MRLLQSQLDRILDRNNPFVAVDVARDSIQECGLTGARTTRNQDIDPAARGDI
jgi:hypothetical protein